MTAAEICGVVFQKDRCVIGLPVEHLEWKVKVEKYGQRSFHQSKGGLVPATTKDLRIVQITDTHFDPHYREGANAVCGELACCRVKQGNATLPENAAGRWGDYRDCDPPWEAVMNMFETIKENHKVG